MRFRTLPFLFACLALLPAGECLAANPNQGAGSSVRESSSIHVLGFAAGDHFDQAETLARALKKAIENSTTQKLGSGEFSLEVLTAALGCPEKPDHACLKKIASKISSQRFLWGTMEVSGQRIDAELHLYADDESDKKAKFSYRAGLTDTAGGELLAIASGAIAQLVGPLRYRVVVQSTEQTGSVLVDGKPAGTLVDGEATFDVAGGDHVFRLKTTGESKTARESKPAGENSASRVLAEQRAKVQVAELTRVRLDPVESVPPVAGENSAPDNTALHREQPKTAEETSFAPSAEKSPHGSAQRTWGYVSLAAGGVLLAGAAAAAADLYYLNHKDNFERYRSGLASTQDACSEGKNGTIVPGAMTPAGVTSLCSNASMLEIGQIVLLATGVVAAGTGLTLLLTDKSDSHTAATRVLPRLVLGRDRADFRIALHF